MCGIAGIVSRHSAVTDADRRAMERMLDALDHRGPDDRGVWLAPSGRVLLGHTRLAILDLSPAGREPMMSSDGTVALVFNGEIYNHLELRTSALRDHRAYRGHCDAETLVEAWRRRGADTLSDLRGFFAFAVFDVRDQQLVLVRDRLGKKPLYYAHVGDRFVFASEIRAVLASGLVRRELDHRSLAAYTAIGSVPPPFTMLDGVRALPPACVLRVEGVVPQEPRVWWTPPPPDGRADRPREELVHELECHLRASVAERVVADVPVGAFLSGGLDSPTVVALMQEATGGRVKTYTVGFDSAAAADERMAAREAAQHLGSDHHELTLSPHDLAPVTVDFFSALDQPTGDGFNTYLASRAVSGDVKVVLSGIGADELFYGYRFWRDAVRIRTLMRARHGVPASWRMRAAAAVGGAQRLGRVGRAAKAFAVAVAPEVGRIALTPAQRARLGVLPTETEAWVAAAAAGPDAGRRADLSCYLGTVLLPDLDAMTMAFSLEARAPFLDHRLVEWALRLPPSTQWDRFGGKALLRPLAASLVPAVAARPKRGFELPLADWMAGPLRTPVDELVASSARRGLVRGDRLRQLVFDVRTRRRHPRVVWHLLVAEAWIQRHVPEASGVDGTT